MQLEHRAMTVPTSNDLLLQIQSISVFAAFVLVFTLPIVVASLFVLLMPTLQVVTSCMMGEHIVWHLSGSVELAMSAAAMKSGMIAMTVNIDRNWRGWVCMAADR
jgi:hypothetical protein